MDEQLGANQSEYRNIEIDWNEYTLEDILKLFWDRIADDPCFWTTIDNRAKWKITPDFEWPSFPKLYNWLAIFIGDCKDIKILNKIVLEIGSLLGDIKYPNYNQLIWWDVKKHVGRILLRVSERLQTLLDSNSGSIWEDEDIKVAALWIMNHSEDHY